MLNFKSYINENYTTYKVGDTVKIRYWLTGDICPVKIIDNPTKNYFIVSHKIEGSSLFNAPDQGIKLSEILGMHQGIETPFDNAKRLTENPTLRPDVSGLIPTWGSWNKNMTNTNNDMSF